MNVRAVIGLVGGVLVFLSSFAHAFAGWPFQRNALVAAGVGADLVASLQIGWCFGSVAMAAFGLVVLGIAVARLRRRPAATWPAGVIGAAYVLFGAGVIVAHGFSGHFVGFIVLGLLVGTLALDRGEG